MKTLKRQDLLYPELSYQIVGAMFDVFNELGYGYREYFYQKALVARLNELGVSFKEQVKLPLMFRGQQVSWQIADFIIDNKIVVELKKGFRISQNDIDQVVSYLKGADVKLGLLARFSEKGLIYRRILNSDSYIRKNS